MLLSEHSKEPNMIFLSLKRELYVFFKFKEKSWTSSQRPPLQSRKILPEDEHNIRRVLNLFCLWVHNGFINRFKQFFHEQKEEYDRYFGTSQK